MSRLDTDTYFMEIAKLVAKRSTCIRRQVGAVLVKGNQILATGYNGAPAGLSHCTNETCLRLKNNSKIGKNMELCRAVHAEANCIIQCALHGTAIDGETTIYSTIQPCIDCLKLILNAKIKKIVYIKGYDSENTVKDELIRESGILTVLIIDNQDK